MHELPVGLQTVYDDAQELVSLSPEELGAAILACHHGGIVGRLIPAEIARPNNNTQPWPSIYWERIEFAVADAIAWLQRAGLIMRVCTGPPSNVFILTSYGKRLTTVEKIKEFKDASILPPHLLHPKLHQEVQQLFTRGNGEVAVFAAFKAVEVAVRTAAKLSNELLGIKLMRRAFDPTSGALTDMSMEPGERQARSDLFAGAIGTAKNPSSHREVEIGREEAARLIVFASHLLTLIDDVRQQRSD